MSDDYRRAIEYLNRLINYEKSPMPSAATGHLNLDRVRRLLDRLDNPQQHYPSLVIAGTKGKGSTAILIAAALQAAGHRVGLYTQPHLHTYRERMRVNGQLIEPDELAALVEECRPAIEAMREDAPRWGMTTYYEAGTGLALLYFARKAVDIAILEVGLGGRLDAVNVVEPLVSVITSMSLDHTAVLGDTIEQIAFEKGGIIKPGVPVVTAPQWPAAREVLLRIALERNAPLHEAQPAQALAGPPPDAVQRRRAFQPVRLEFGPQQVEVKLALLGEHQRLNAAVAAAALWQQSRRPGGCPLSSRNVQAGFEQVEWPARLQTLADRPGQPLLVADGAHNAESAARLRQALPENFYFEKLWLVVGVYADKDVEGIFEQLCASPAPAGMVLTRSTNSRALPPESLLERAGDRLRAANIRVEVSPSVPEAIQQALELAGPLDLICCTGSLSVAAEAAGVDPA